MVFVIHLNYFYPPLELKMSLANLASWFSIMCECCVSEGKRGQAPSPHFSPATSFVLNTPLFGTSYVFCQNCPPLGAPAFQNLSFGRCFYFFLLVKETVQVLQRIILNIVKLFNIYKSLKPAKKPNGVYTHKLSYVSIDTS